MLRFYIGQHNNKSTVYRHLYFRLYYEMSIRYNITTLKTYKRRNLHGHQWVPSCTGFVLLPSFKVMESRYDMDDKVDSGYYYQICHTPHSPTVEDELARYQAESRHQSSSDSATTPSDVINRALEEELIRYAHCPEHLLYPPSRRIARDEEIEKEFKKNRLRVSRRCDRAILITLVMLFVFFVAVLIYFIVQHYQGN